jgi:hypothetical protein
MIKTKITAALLITIFALAIGDILIPSTAISAAYAQAEEIPQQASTLNADAIDDILDIIGINGDQEASEDESNTQTVEQPIDQEVNQEVDQSEDSDQDNDNTQTQVGAIDQDIAQGIVDGDDSAKSESESGDAKHKSSSSSESGDAENVNAQDAENNAELNQDQHQDVTQTNEANFGDDTTELDAANAGVPIAVQISVQEDGEESESDDELPPPEESDEFSCFTGSEGLVCFDDQEECLAAEEIDDTEALCEEFETLPESASLCRAEELFIVC